MMSAVAGLLPEVTTVVSNAVALHPVVPRLARLTSRYATNTVGRFMKYLNPQWGRPPRAGRRRSTGRVRSTHPRVQQCGLQAFELHLRHRLPGAVAHENLDRGYPRVARRRVRSGADDLLPPNGQMHRCRAPRTDRQIPSLPMLHRSAGPPRTDARFVFFAGGDQCCFLPPSQQRTYDYFDPTGPGRLAAFRHARATGTSTCSSAACGPRHFPAHHGRAAELTFHRSRFGAAMGIPRGRNTRRRACLCRRHRLRDAGQLRDSPALMAAFPIAGTRRRAAPARRRASGPAMDSRAADGHGDPLPHDRYRQPTSNTRLAIACTTGAAGTALAAGRCSMGLRHRAVRGRPAGQQRGVREGRQGHLGHAQAPGQPRLHDHAARCPASTTSTASSVRTSRSTAARVALPLNVGATNYCVFRGMLMKSMIYFHKQAVPAGLGTARARRPSARRG